MLWYNISYIEQHKGEIGQTHSLYSLLIFCYIALDKRNLDPLIEIGAIKDKINLILDIDSTIVHAITDYDAKGCGDKLKRRIRKGEGVAVKFKIGPIQHVLGLVKRPYLDEFLRNVSKFCNIYLYTNGEEEYAKAVVKALDPEQKYLS